MLQSSTITKSDARKTRKGWLGHKVKQVHLREDIPCGFSYCRQHSVNLGSASAFDHDPVSQDTIYFIDTQTLIQQIDIVYNCEDIKNLIILQSSIEHLRKRSLNKYNAFKNFIQTEGIISTNTSSQMQEQKQTGVINQSRNIFIFADEYHKPTQNQTYIRQKSEYNKLFKIILWYRQHLQQIELKSIQLKILTNDNQILATKTPQGFEVVPLVAFLQKNNSNLLDFIVFSSFNQQEMEQESIFDQLQEHHEAQKLIKQGKLFEGKYMSQKSYIKIGKNIKRIKLVNNRALFGDVVAVQISPVEQWDTVANKSTPEDDQQIANAKQQVIQDLGGAQNSKIQAMRKVLKSLQENPTLVPKGTVKSILKRNTKNYCGSVDTQKLIKSAAKKQNTGPGWQIYKFKSADDRFPQFYIRTYNSKALQGKRIQVSFDSWPKNSELPLCHFLRIIGNIGDSRAEGDVILLQHNVQIKQFSKQAYECLPKAGQNFTIPKEQQEYRLDLRNLDVVSIDPPGCKDIDDALHCVRLPNGNLSVGVHIADVSYYVRPDSALDLEARNRCTTVYLVDRRTDMLPKLLTQNLCSLRSNVDRLSFSCIWQIEQQTANIVKTQYAKTIIRSRNAFTYMEAQQLKDSDSKSNIAKSIRLLNKIAKKLKQKRLDKGALTLASTQVKITLEEETHSATDVQLYQMVQTNYLIEEFMLLANCSVAQKIYERFPALSILRRHTPPKISELETLKELLKIYGYEMHFETSKALADSLNSMEKQGDPFFNKLIRILTTRCMNEATYFCSADFDPQQFYHYGLAAQFYTHFTSPIRRYADILVHRLLSAAIDLQPLPHFMINKIKMTKVCEKMNMRNRMARYASRASSDYHTYQFFRAKEGNKQKGVIVSIKQSEIVIMLVGYGLECKYQLDQNDSKQTIQMNKGQGVFNKCQVKEKAKKLFEYLDVSLQVEMHGFHKKMIIQIE